MRRLLRTLRGLLASSKPIEDPVLTAALTEIGGLRRMIKELRTERHVNPDDAWREPVQTTLDQLRTEFEALRTNVYSVQEGLLAQIDYERNRLDYALGTLEGLDNLRR